MVFRVIVGVVGHEITVVHIGGENERVSHDPEGHGQGFDLKLNEQFRGERVRSARGRSHRVLLTVFSSDDRTKCFEVQMIVLVCAVVIILIDDNVQIGKVSIEIHTIGIRSTDQPISGTDHLQRSRYAPCLSLDSLTFNRVAMSGY